MGASGPGRPDMPSSPACASHGRPRSWRGAWSRAPRGTGPFIAAKILGEVGDPSRIRSKPAFAVLSGTAPLSASSGQVQRHRLNRGGNRQLNWALHYIALVQCRITPEAQAYMARKREAGKSHKEAMRCLKRQLSNVVYRHLVADARRAELAA